MESCSERRDTGLHPCFICQCMMILLHDHALILYSVVYLMPMQTGLQAEERFHHSSEPNGEHCEGLCEDDL